MIINRQETPEQTRARLLLEAERWWKEPEETEWRAAMLRAGISQGRLADVQDLSWAELPKDIKDALVRALDDGRRDWRNSGCTLGDLKYGKKQGERK